MRWKTVILIGVYGILCLFWGISNGEDIGKQGNPNQRIIFSDSLIVISVAKNIKLDKAESLFVSAVGSTIQACLYDSDTREMFIELLMIFNATRIKQLEESLLEENK